MNEIATQLSFEINNKKENLLKEILRENNIDPANFEELSKNCKFIQPYGRDYQIFNCYGRDLLELHNPEIILTEDLKFKIEFKYRKLYENK